MQLSKRLTAVANMVTSPRPMADVGTDHGYIPICLCLEGKVEHAIAMDVNPGPLSRARDNIELYQMENRVETRLSDGVAALRIGEVDTVVIAGMGGSLVIKILEEGKEVLESVGHLVLQPQSDLGKVRHYLGEHGYKIVDEDMVKEDGKYYPMMLVEKGEMKGLTDCELSYGPDLIKKKHPVLKEFLQKEEAVCREILKGLSGKTGEHILERSEEIEKKLAVICQAREEMK